MPKARGGRPWTKHFGLPQIPVVITNPRALVQVKEDGIRGRCRVAPANDVDWERVTQWRWEDVDPVREDCPVSLEAMSVQECAAERRQIAADLTRAKDALIFTKRSNDRDAIRDLGRDIHSLEQRAAAAKVREFQLMAQAKGDALRRAVKEILPPELRRQVRERAKEIEQEMLNG
ncbi:hypothetical protein ACFOKF_16385 [Sphingobium rhizovicinum]|uniref:Uncharacterized protein n=1 Tax=Sphingobium rhizovicinum TaxID=432308 RepID=A0ABV7NGZ0_9SPHN